MGELVGEWAGVLVGCGVDWCGLVAYLVGGAVSDWENELCVVDWLSFTCNFKLFDRQTSDILHIGHQHL